MIKQRADGLLSIDFIGMAVSDQLCTAVIAPFAPNVLLIIVAIPRPLQRAAHGPCRSPVFF